MPTPTPTDARRAGPMALTELDAWWKDIDSDNWIDVTSGDLWEIVLQGPIIMWPAPRAHRGDTLPEAIESARKAIESLAGDGN